MTKKALILIFLLLVIYLAFVFVKTRQADELFSNQLKERVFQITEAPRERITDFLEERRETVEKEIEEEKEQIKEDAKETGSRIWEEVVNFILRKNTEEE